MTTEELPYDPTTLVTLRGGILRGSRTPRTRGSRLHLYITGPTHRGPDMFLTPAEARQWATTLALAAAVAHGEDAGDSDAVTPPVMVTVTHDPLESLIVRWRGEAAVANEQASADVDCGDHAGIARNTERAETIHEFLRELQAVIGL